ncbi:MAG TPA: type I pullulanase [Bacillota bacterium]|nr:type I pullulanase [Bacillota bacterium]HPJ86049.1 type I pullulanase [Bacillota bacterium]HRX91520.1 type I pullulanase [Candidatus Izemoplasmatales bacterium]
MTKDDRKFYCYLDDFDLLTIIVPGANYKPTDTYSLNGNDETIPLVIGQQIALDKETKLVCSFDAYIELRKIYYVENQDGESSELYTGKIVRTELFDNIYRYRKNDLGFTFTKESTKFKIWSPVAKSVRLELLYPNGRKSFHDMEYKNAGVWRHVVDEDLEKVAYRYHVYVNGKETIVEDPYALSSKTHGSYSYVIDKTRLTPIEPLRSFSGNPLDAVVYEMNVRDFSMDDTVPFRHRGKFLGVVEPDLKTPEGHPAGLDHLKYLGITHIQLMPIFDFGDVDETKPDRLYNWGYNPEQYFVPQGWYSTDPDDPYCRIEELRKMIDALHRENIGVIMDVVYNHVFDAKKFPFEKLVPGYAYRVDRQGIYTDVSGCGNDLDTNREMVRKIIIDSVLYWANEFKVDGFRFDLMGLIDFETMNEVRQELSDIDDHFLVYGEGWKMYSTNVGDRMAHMYNKNVLYTIGFFNSIFRDTVKGSTFDILEKGYATGDPVNAETVRQLLFGSALGRYIFKYTTQSINYVECHDNMTFFDKAMKIDKDSVLAKEQEKLATSMVILAQGVPFLHSGQEFYRSKKNVENSFKSGDGINKLDWSLLDENHADVEYLRHLINIRRHYPCFRLKADSELKRSAEAFVLPSKSIMVHYNGECNLIIVFKPLADEEFVVIPEEYRLLLSSVGKKDEPEDGARLFKNIGTWIFTKESE